GRSLHKIGGGDQRTPPVDRDLPRRPGAVLVIENLERQVATIACRLHGSEETGDVEVALSRHVSEVPAPGEKVHIEERRIADPQQKKPVAWYGADRIRVDIPRHGVEGIKDQTDSRVIGA